MASPCGCGDTATCSCVIEDGCGTTVTGAGTVASPYVIDATSNITFGDTVVAAAAPDCVDEPAIMLDPDTGIQIGFWTPGSPGAWEAVAGGGTDAEVYAGTGASPNTTIGDPGVAEALYYDHGNPAEGYPPDGTPTVFADSLWMWDDGAAAWERYPKVIHASISMTADDTFATGTWSTFNSAATEVFDTADMYAAGNPGRIYAPYDGIYQVNGFARWDAVTGATVGTRQARLEKNGSGALFGVHNLSYHAAGTMSETRIPFLFNNVVLAAGDYIKLAGRQDSGGSITARLLEFTMRLIARTG